MSKPQVDHQMLEAAREAFLKLLALYQPLDQMIAAKNPNWDPKDHFCAHLAALCEDTALTMLGADNVLTEEEMIAFNTIFSFNESREDIAEMAQFLNQRGVTDEELFGRLDRFMLSSSMVDNQTGSERTLEALAYFQSLGQVIALIDNRYHLREDMFYRALLQRIEKNWRQVDHFVSEGEPALMLTLKDGSKRLFHLD